MADVYSCITADSDWWDGTESWGGEVSEAARDTKFSTRNFSSVSAWESDRDGNSSGGNVEIAVLVGPFTAAITSTQTIAGFNADSVEIQAPITLNDSQANPARHLGYNDGGNDHWRMAVSSGHSFSIQESTTIDGLEVVTENTGTSNECFSVEAGITLWVKNTIGGFGSNNSEQDFVATHGSYNVNVHLENCHIWNCERAGIDLYAAGSQTYVVSINACHFYNLGDGHRGGGGRGGIVGHGSDSGSTVTIDIRNTLAHFDADSDHVCDLVASNGTLDIDECITSEGDWSSLNITPTVTNSEVSHTWATTDQGAGNYVIHVGVEDLPAG